MNCYYLGIDLGTSSLKVCVIDEKGQAIDNEREEYPCYCEHGFSEQEPNDWFFALKKALANLGKRVDLGQIEGLSFSGQMHGLVCLDEKKEVLRRAILWNDERSKKESEEINRYFGEKELIAMTGNVSYPGFWASKILWLKRNEPRTFSQMRHLLFPKDYLVYRITGNIMTDVSDASGSLIYDPKSKQWSSRLAAFLGLDPSIFPDIHESTFCAGRIEAVFARETGLNPEAKVIIGGGDQAVGAVGSETFGGGKMFISIGTSGVVYLSQTNYPRNPNGCYHVFDACDGNYLKMGVTLSAGGSLDWLMRKIFLETSYGADLKDVGRFRVDDPVFLPYLAGERSPIRDPNASGCFFGLQLGTSKNDLIRSVMEGVAFSLYDCYLSLKPKNKKAVLIGGGASSPFWCQFLSTLLDIELDKPLENRDPSFGAALLAFQGSTQRPIPNVSFERKTYLPNRHERPQLLKKYRQYKKLYLALKDSFQND